MVDIGADNLVFSEGPSVDEFCIHLGDLAWDAGDGDLFFLERSPANDINAYHPQATDESTWEDTIHISFFNPPESGSYVIFVDGRSITIAWDDTEAELQAKFDAEGLDCVITGNAVDFEAYFPDAPVFFVTSQSGLVGASTASMQRSIYHPTTLTIPNSGVWPSISGTSLTQVGLPEPAFFYEDTPSRTEMLRIRTIFEASPAQNSNTLTVPPAAGVTGTWSIDLSGFSAEEGVRLIVAIFTVGFPDFAGTPTEPVALSSNLNWERLTTLVLPAMFGDQVSRLTIFMSSLVPAGWDVESPIVTYSGGDGAYHDTGVVAIATVQGDIVSINVDTGKGAEASTSANDENVLLTLAVGLVYAYTGIVEPDTGFNEIVAAGLIGDTGPVMAYKEGGSGNPLWMLDPDQWSEDPSWAIAILRFT